MNCKGFENSTMKRVTQYHASGWEIIGGKSDLSCWVEGKDLNISGTYGGVEVEFYCASERFPSDLYGSIVDHVSNMVAYGDSGYTQKDLESVLD